MLSRLNLRFKKNGLKSNDTSLHNNVTAQYQNMKLFL